MTLASKIAVLRDGMLQQVGSPAEIYNHPANVFVADFMGSPAMNLLDARVAGRNGGAVIEVARENEPAIALRMPPGVIQSALSPGRQVILGIRPEAITDPAGADRNSTIVDVIEALVEVVEPAGSDTYVVTRAGGKEVIARMRADADVRPGTRIPFAFD